MRFRSKKTERLYRQRRTLVVQLLDEFPICQRCGTNPSQDIHEVVRRSQGGSILDPANLRALCRLCHSWITEHPKLAEEEGLSAPSWQRDNYSSDKYLRDVEGRPE